MRGARASCSVRRLPNFWAPPAFGHAIVLTGIEGDTLHLNDPDDQKGGDDGRRTTGTIAWFNSHLYWDWDRGMMYKPTK